MIWFKLMSGLLLSGHILDKDWFLPHDVISEFENRWLSVNKFLFRGQNPNQLWASELPVKSHKTDTKFMSGNFLDTIQADVLASEFKDRKQRPIELLNTNSTRSANLWYFEASCPSTALWQPYGLQSSGMFKQNLVVLAASLLWRNGYRKRPGNQSQAACEVPWGFGSLRLPVPYLVQAAHNLRFHAWRTSWTK